MNAADLREEAIVFGRYLLGSEPEAALVERFCRANETLFADERDDALVAFARQHPWSIAMLDAAAGLAEPGSLLRKKLLVMTAIIETTPSLVERTTQQAVSLPRLALRLGAAGARTAVNAATGLALLAWVKRRA